MSALQDGIIKNTTADQALHEAVEKHDVRGVCRALDQGANPNVPYEDGILPVMKLVGRRSNNAITPWIIVMELIRAGADHLVTDEDGESLVHHAARCDQADVIETLIALPGLDVHIRCSEGRTPLFNAAAQSRLNAIKTLLAWGADPLVTSNPDGVMGPDYQPINAIDYCRSEAYYAEALLSYAMEEAEGEAA